MKSSWQRIQKKWFGLAWWIRKLRFSEVQIDLIFVHFAHIVT